MDKRVIELVKENFKGKKVDKKLITIKDNEVFYEGVFVDVIDDFLIIPEAEIKPEFNTAEEAIEYYAKQGDGKAMQAWVDLSQDRQRIISTQKFLNGEL